MNTPEPNRIEGSAYQKNSDVLARKTIHTVLQNLDLMHCRPENAEQLSAFVDSLKRNRESVHDLNVLQENLFLVKQINPNVLTSEASSFFHNVHTLVQDYFSQIDTQPLYIDYTKLHSGEFCDIVWK